MLPKNRELKEILTFSQTSMLPKNREFLEFEDFFFLKNFSIHFNTHDTSEFTPHDTSWFSRTTSEKATYKGHIWYKWYWINSKMKEFEIVLIKKCLSNHGTNKADSQLFLITDIPIILNSLNKREWIHQKIMILILKA